LTDSSRDGTGENVARRAYSTDLSDADWNVIEPVIPVAKPGGRPARYERREIVNAVLYVVRTKCPWRLLPHDFPPWQTVYHYYRLWRKQGVWREAYNRLLQAHRKLGNISDGHGVSVEETFGDGGWDS
jgi:transposase